MKLKYELKRRIFNDDCSKLHDIKEYNILKSSSEKIRINLMITSVQSKDVYAGIKTAIDFFMKFKKYGVDLRILVMGTSVDKKSLYSIPDFSVVSNEEDSVKYSIVDISENSSEFVMRGNDYFLGTMWYTIYNANIFLEEQKKIFGKRNSLIYLIQDYEPGFYAWSSEYLLAESTYNIQDQIVIFNSKYLKDYFDTNHYNFRNSYYFNPILNEKLGQILLSSINDLPERKKQIVFYGRPNKSRNAFALICMALRKWSEIDPNYKDWKVYAAGEDIGNINLSNGLSVESLGKMSIDEYAKVMLESRIGISLMASPHPSYPPLEMATFGMKVITNSFETKNIEDFSDNILSINHINIDNLANAIKKLTENKEFHISKNEDYINGINQLDSIISDIAKTIGIDYEAKIFEN
jgi:hypothetical protein